MSLIHFSLVFKMLYISQVGFRHWQYSIIYIIEAYFMEKQFCLEWLSIEMIQFEENWNQIMVDEVQSLYETFSDHWYLIIMLFYVVVLSCCSTFILVVIFVVVLRWVKG